MSRTPIYPGDKHKVIGISAASHSRQYGLKHKQIPRDAIQSLLNFRTANTCDDISLDEVRQAKEEGRG